ncbi:hypothetical protein [Caballeronia sp. ATUFL_M2_KS44]|uniref:hypothetical protein n=1 Tax=Caballeronia sp. ATUFL_M2_KS44 TaxID=2921767 RepID=UPI00202932CF|nr:hypothetical protein [Caballeronia sp. ATUFL_M2_KS44]
MDSIFSPPGFDWTKDKARELRQVIGAKKIGFWRAANLLCRMYGYAGWNELKELRSLDPPFPTEWDDQLDEYHLTERYDRFIDELNAELDIDDEQSQAILRKVNVSSRNVSYASTSSVREAVAVSDVDDFADRLAGILAALAPQIAAARSGGRQAIRSAYANRR